jgi:hypothetical protein
MAKTKGRRLPDGVFLKDILQLFERTVIDMAKPYSRRYGWTAKEADPVVKDLLGMFAEATEEYGGYVEVEDWDVLVSYAKQEETRRMIRGSLS